jgi:hypothetical protein
MSAGLSATVSPEDETPQAQDPDLPHKPRQLTLGEATSREIFLFHSPKNHRTVKVAEYLHLALALRFEFDPSVESYVERPRKISVSPKFAVDIGFWTRSLSGQETFFIGVPNAGTPGHKRDGAFMRDRERMELAAQRHDLTLTYITEQELLTESIAIRTYFELLPHVQYARRIPSRLTIGQGIKAFFTLTPRASFRTLIGHLPQFGRDKVLSVTASLLHRGDLRVDLTRRLSLDSMLEEAHV